MKTIVPRYGCSQQDLYSTGNLGWGFCNERLAEFTAFKSKYNKTYINSMLLGIEHAENLPDAPNRQQRRSTLKVDFKEAATGALNLWQMLKQYIIDAYPENQQKIQLSAAGAGYYNKASAFNWSALLSLLNAGNQYIEKNISPLSEHENMPAGFPATFLESKSTCNRISQEYFSSESIKAQATTDKIKANNTVYSSLSAMCKDGQRIFAKQEDIKKQFVFENLLNLSGRGGAAGIRGLFADDATGLPIEGVKISTEDGRYVTTSQKDSRYSIKRMEAGTYTVTISKKGYLTVSKTITLKKRTASNLDQKLTQTMLSVVAA